MRQSGFVSWVLLVLLMGSVMGVGVVAAQVATDPTRVAVYAATIQADPSTVVISTKTTWGSSGSVMDQELIAASNALSQGMKKSADLISVTAALPNPDKDAVIQLKEYPLYLLPDGGKNLRFGFSIEFPSGANVVKGVQTFDPGLHIQITVPGDSNPFLLFQNKGKPIYLKNQNGDVNLPELKGTVTSKGDGKYEVLVKSWLAGDPCGGG